MKRENVAYCIEPVSGVLEGEWERVASIDDHRVNVHADFPGGEAHVLDEVFTLGLH